MFELKVNDYKRNIVDIPNSGTIPCPNCRNYIYTTDKKCPYCGCTVGFERTRSFIKNQNTDLSENEIRFYKNGMYSLHWDEYETLSQYSCVECSDFYDVDGNCIFPKEYQKYEKEFYEDAGRFIIYKSQSNGQLVCGLFSTEGKAVVDFVCDALIADKYRLSRSNPYIICKYKGKTGIIDINNNCHLSFEYEDCRILDYENMIVAVKDNGKWGARSLEIPEIIPCMYEDIGYCSPKEKLISVKQDGLWGFVDYKNYLQIPCSYEDVYRFNDGVCSANYEGKRILLNTNGQIVKERRKKISDSLFQVSRGGELFYIDSKGNKAFNVECDSMHNYHEYSKTITIKKGNKYGVIDLKGRVVIPPIYDSISNSRLNFIVEKDNKVGVVDYQSRIVIPIQYESIYPVEGYGELFQVYETLEKEYNGNKFRKKYTGIMDSRGKIIIPAIHTSIGTFVNGFAECESFHAGKGRYRGIMDLFGNYIEQ